MRSFILCLLQLGVHLVAGGQTAALPIKYQFRDYPLDTLLLLRKQAGIPDTLRVFYLNRLSFATSVNDLPTAVQYIREAYNLARRVGYVRGELNCLKQLGNYYGESGDYVQALTYYQQGVDLAYKHNRPVQLARFYLNMGATAAKTGDGELSLKYLLMCYTEYKKAAVGTVDVPDSAMLFSNLANTYEQLHRFALARKYALNSVRLYQSLPEKEGAASAYGLLGRIYQRQQDNPRGNAAHLDSAGVYLRRAVLLNHEAGNGKEEAGGLLNLAELCQQQGRIVEMKDVAVRALVLAERVGAKPIQAEASALLGRAYYELGAFRQAYTYSEQASALNTIVLDVEKSKALTQLEIKYDVRTREHQIKILEKEAQLAARVRNEQEKRQRWLLQVSWMLILCLFGAGVLYWRLQKSRGEVTTANAELVTANQELRAAGAEKEVLVQEIHHRVKNNLQMVRSLLSWQVSVFPNPALAGVLANTQARIQSMALVHEFLYQADNLAQVRLDTYLGELLDALHLALTSPDQPVQLTTELEPVVMETKQASALGVLVSELVTNAYKHAFKDQPAGQLHVSLVSHPKGFHLRVIDDGVGLNGSDLREKPTSLGIQIVKSLAKQLKATLSSVPQLPKGISVEVTSN